MSDGHLTCPTCKERSALGPSNPSRPFCSVRCKMLDLGRWFDGAYVLAGEDAVGFDGVSPDLLPPYPLPSPDEAPRYHHDDRSRPRADD